MINITVKWISRGADLRQKLAKYWRDYLVLYIFILVGVLIPIVGLLFQECCSNEEHFSRSGGAMIAWALMWAPLTRRLLDEKTFHAFQMAQKAGDHNAHNWRMVKAQKAHFTSVASDTKEKSDIWFEAEVFILIYGTLIWSYGGLAFNS